MSRCPQCHAEWTGRNGGHCKGCHRTFTSDTAADRHYRSLSGFAGCHDPATLTHPKTGVRIFQWNERRQAWSLAGSHRYENSNPEQPQAESESP